MRVRRIFLFERAVPFVALAEKGGVFFLFQTFIAFFERENYNMKHE